MSKRDDLLSAFTAGTIHGWSNSETLNQADIEACFDKWFKDHQPKKPRASRKKIT